MTDAKKTPNRANGALKLAADMTPEQKSDRARKGALARWAKPPNVTHKGNFKEDFGLDVDCYVLDDSGKTAVISQRGMGAALGLTTSGQSFIRFVSGKTIAPFLGAETRAKIENPLKYQWVPRGAEKQPPGEFNGYDVTLLIDVCQAIVTAEQAGKLHHSQRGVAKQAHIILGASAKAGIKGLVYALAGYRPEIEEVIQAFKAFVQAEAKKYESEFPVELYIEWARLYGHRPQRSWKDMHLTINHVYYPLAKSDGKLLDLLRDAKSSSGARNAKLFQFLTLVGVKALRFQLGRIYDVAQSSPTSEVYEREVAKRFGDQRAFDFSTAGERPTS